MRLTAFVICAFLTLLALPARAAELVNMPGTAWSFAVPEGFVLARDPVTMFRNGNGVAFTITQHKAETIDLASLGRIGDITGAGRDRARLDAARDMTLPDGRHALFSKTYLLNLKAQVMALAIEGKDSNGVVVAAIPDLAAGQTDFAMIEAVLATAVETPMTMEQRAEGLPYRFEDLNGMRIVDIQAGSFSLITDGPGTDIDIALDQPFAMILTTDAGGQSIMTIEDDDEGVRQQIIKRYPNADILGTVMRDTAKGRVLEATYTRKDAANGKTLGGIAWFRIDGRTMVLMLAQYPIPGGGAYDRFAKIRDGIVMK
ncbi:hypothetical protein [Pararhizobium sp.]|uniref:hypothetical protein n=1 Tax=Pararhizobium sp. TaxID=1977563 RepID=UPI0027195010|nr:hypothetical protein [Pararhizobium sp.]MDO9417184.1 hypothetical protein [Pararhizobium sp.]